MPNQPGPQTKATSFTLPRNLLALVEQRAKREMTNKSDIIRRALMNYLTPAERAEVQAKTQIVTGVKATGNVKIKQ